MGTSQQQKYKIRPGTVDSGKEYEIKIAALLSLRCVLHGADEMWIASNAADVGAFDDIILHVKTTENVSATFMMQLKHKDNQNNILEKEFTNHKGDFSLKIYSKDISDLQQAISSNPKPKFVESLGQFEDIYFVFFTNRGETKKSDILQKKHDSNGPIRFLKDVVNTNTNTNTNSLFGFNVQNLSEVASKNNFNNVFLLANQLSFNYIDRLIVDNINKIVDPAGLTQVDVTNMAQNFVMYIKDWARGLLGGHYCLTKQDVLTKISDLFFTHYAVNLRQNYFRFHYCRKKNIWNHIMNQETITIVDSNNAVLEFLVEYLGSEIIKYCDLSSDTFWYQNLSDQAQTLFYQTNQHLKQQMLKIVGNFGKITLLDIYKCLWMVNKLPLLLKVNRIQDYKNILHVLKFTNYSYKVVIVNNSTGNLSSHQTGTKTFCTLQDLHSGYKDAILKLPIKLQGRVGVSLGSVIDETMYQYIKCNDIINILSDDFNIGNNLEPLCAYFIERSYIKTVIKAQALKTIKDDVFLLDNRSNRYFAFFPQNDFNACNLEDIDFNFLNNCNVILLQESDDPQVIIQQVGSLGRAVHYLKMHDGNSFQRKWSSGSTKNIKHFQIQKEEEYEKDFTPYFSNNVNIISDTAGMGKSTLMDYIQHKAPISKWVIRVNLNSHQKYFYDCKNSNVDVPNHLRYFNDMMYTENLQSSELSQIIFEKRLNKKDIIVLLDGFDEVSFSHEAEVIKIAKRLFHEGHQIWLTTRPHMQAKLENTFETFSISLKPFSKDDQYQFLVKFFIVMNSRLVLDSQFLLEKFVSKLLSAARNNLNDSDAKFTGIPLQSKLLAEVFNDDCREYLHSEGTVCFNETFDLVYLYQNFINKKIDILFIKFGESVINLHTMFKKHQSLFALKLLYPYHGFIKKHVNEELDAHYTREPDNIQLLQTDGVITVDEKQNIVCTHRTFAEFLAAKWVLENLNSEQAHIKRFINDIVIKRRFNYNNDRFFSRMLNLLLISHNCPAHMAIINRQIGKAKEIISLDLNSAVKSFDKGRRSILHILALFGRDMLYTFENLNFDSDDMLDIIKIIPDDAMYELAIKKDLLGYTPLDYAMLNRSFTIANWICSKNETVTINNCSANPIDKFQFEFILRYNYQPLFKVLLPSEVYCDLLTKTTDLKLDVVSYLDISDVYDENHFVHSYRKKTLLQVMQSKIGYPYSGFTDNHYSDLRFAAAFGTEQNVRKLLSEGTEINKLHYNYYTPLHYAVLHARLKIVKILLRNGAKINIQDYHENTPLHLAVREHMKTIGDSDADSPNYISCIINKQNYNVASHLLKKGANVNKQNFRKETPLHIILGRMWKSYDYESRLTIYSESSLFFFIYNSNVMGLAKLLISNGANVNTEDEQGYTYLQNAASNGYCDLVKILLAAGADINKQNESGHAALHVAATSKVATLLIAKGANIHLVRNIGETALHCQASEGEVQIVKLLLQNGVDINKQTNNGDTALHLAGTSKVATLLIAKGANIHLVSNIGETALHCQASKGKVEIVEMLLQNGVDINKQTNNGDTALHLVAPYVPPWDLETNYTRTIELLLAHGADTNIKNTSGQTYLDK